LVVVVEEVAIGSPCKQRTAPAPVHQHAALRQGMCQNYSSTRMPRKRAACACCASNTLFCWCAVCLHVLVGACVVVRRQQARQCDCQCMGSASSPGAWWLHAASRQAVAPDRQVSDWFLVWLVVWRLFKPLTRQAFEHPASSVSVTCWGLSIACIHAYLRSLATQRQE
jgi:hypothetical protein